MPATEGDFGLQQWLPMAMMVLDPCGNILHANDFAQARIGTSLRRFKGEHITHFFAPENEINAMLKRANNGETLSGDAFYSRREHMPHYLYFGPWDDRGVVVMLIPEGNRNEAETMFRQQEMAEAVARIALEMAHEVKNPLTSLRGAAQLLSEELQADQQVMCQHILDETDRIKQRIDAFLQVGPRAGVKMEMTNIHALLDDVCKASKATQVRRVYDPAIPLLNLHESRIRQAIENLWQNALEVGSSLIELQTRATSLVTLQNGYQGMVFELRFSSNGDPVPPSLRDRLFEPYTSAKSRGSGLGLSIVQQVMLEHDGRVMFQADAHQTSFILHLPLHTGVAAEKRGENSCAS